MDLREIALTRGLDPRGEFALDHLPLEVCRAVNAVAAEHLPSHAPDGIGRAEAEAAWPRHPATLKRLRSRRARHLRHRAVACLMEHPKAHGRGGVGYVRRRLRRLGFPVAWTTVAADIELWRLRGLPAPA